LSIRGRLVSNETSDPIPRCLDDCVRPIAPGVYAIGSSVMIFAVGRLALENWPLHVADAVWRLGLVGTASQSFYWVVLGAALLGVAALSREDRAVLRAVSAAALIGAACLLFGSVLVLKDVTHLAPTAQSGDQLFVATATVVVLCLVACVALLSLGRLLWKSAVAPL